MRKAGAAIAVIGAVYLVVVGWVWSWWYVPELLKLGARAFVEQTPMGGTPFFILWGVSGVLGAVIVALGAALYAAIGTGRWLLLAAGAAALILWLVLWMASAQHGVVFGAGGGIILFCFLAICLDWAAMRRGLKGTAAVAADLRLASYASFFIAAWGLCGLLGAPIFLLHPEARTAASGGTTMAVKVLVCLVLGWTFTALAQRLERRQRGGP